MNEKILRYISCGLLFSICLSILFINQNLVNNRFNSGHHNSENFFLLIWYTLLIAGTFFSWIGRFKVVSILSRSVNSIHEKI